ncbi:hypothetical protein TNCV_809121 [Trichonephila clavipes]|nr:hypothetical protein TNCV_809121 [Trichonephila clavipes]
MSTKLAWEQNTGVSRLTNHLTETSPPQRLRVCSALLGRDYEKDFQLEDSFYFLGHDKIIQPSWAANAGFCQI